MQVRQRVGHKRTFLYLEQLILKHGAQRGCLSIETFRDGMDFYFPDKGKAARLVFEVVVVVVAWILFVDSRAFLSSTHKLYSQNRHLHAGSSPS